jgi:hypothetical protein
VESPVLVFEVARFFMLTAHLLDAHPPPAVKPSSGPTAWIRISRPAKIDIRQTCGISLGL